MLTAYSGLNKMIEQTVSLKERSYPIHIGAGAFGLALADLRGITQAGGKVVCVADALLPQLYPEFASALVDAGVRTIPVHGGESSKCFSTYASLCEAFAQAGLDRKSTVAAWGGGVIGDLAGFAAATYMRGLPFVQIPTTLLSMVDSSVGGKTGINISAGKNLVGAFHQPRAVYADISFLKTLSAREFAAGMAEVVKCGALGDPQLFAELEKLGNTLTCDSPYLPEAVRRSCALKAAIVSADERETAKEGGRALLNLGHTLGHAVEKCAGYGTFVHGEAVAIGMVFAAKLSEKLGTLSASDAKRIEKVLENCALPTQLPKKLSRPKLVEAMHRDKKSVGGSLRFVLLDGIGKSYTKTLDESVVSGLL